MFLYRVRGFAQSLSLKVVKLLLPLVQNDPLLMDPGSLGHAAKELDVILPVTCRERERKTSYGIYILKHLKTLVKVKTGAAYLWC